MTPLPLKMMQVCQSVYIVRLSTFQYTAVYPWEPVTIHSELLLLLHSSNQQTRPKTFTESTGTEPPGTQRHADFTGHQRTWRIAETLRCNRPREANFKGCAKRQRVLPFLLCFHFAHISINECSLGIPANVSESMFWPVLAFRWPEALQGKLLMHVVMSEH